MKSGVHHLIGSAVVLALSVFASPVLAEGAEVWIATASFGGGYAIKTPCSADEIGQMPAVESERISGVDVKISQGVECSKRGQLFQAAVARSIGAVTPTAPLFDRLIDGITTEGSLVGQQRLTTINGRRAWLNTGAEHGYFAQASIIEIGPDSVAFLTGGAFPESGLDAAGQMALVERYFSSFEASGV